MSTMYVGRMEEARVRIGRRYVYVKRTRILIY